MRQYFLQSKGERKGGRGKFKGAGKKGFGDTAAAAANVATNSFQVQGRCSATEIWMRTSSIWGACGWSLASKRRRQ